MSSSGQEVIICNDVGKGKQDSDYPIVMQNVCRLVVFIYFFPQLGLLQTSDI